MRHFLGILGFALGGLVHASSVLPPEVGAFMEGREACDHFRGEPHEGNSPEQIERRNFIFESLEIYCPGTDRRLAALKKRYEDNAEVMNRLRKYEDRIEGSCP
jgi:hypothetical protein